MLIFWANQKGGVGKTTLSVHHAGHLANRGCRVALFDADTQQSARPWLEAANQLIHVEVAASDITAIPQQLIRLGKDFDHVVIDGPGGLGEETRTIMVMADLIFMPITPSILDMRSVKTAIAAVGFASAIAKKEKPAYLVGNKIAKTGKKSRELDLMAPKLGLPILESRVRYLEGFKDAAQDSCFVWDLRDERATADMKALLSEIDAIINPVILKEAVHG